MRLLQINTAINSGSTGRIAEEIGKVVMQQGHESYIAYGRGNRPSLSDKIKIGSKYDVYLHGLKSALFDRHGFGSQRATKKLIKTIEEIEPDVIGLHNLHGYYLNIDVLFNYLARKKTPVLWTLFDCWAFTGHCTYFDDIDCNKWKEQCYNCPKVNKYPASYFCDNSKRNYSDKKNLFNSLERLELVVHSKWLEGLVRNSFLDGIPIHTLPSGVDLEVFKQTKSDLRKEYGFSRSYLILGCARPWSERKGLADFIKLRKLLDNRFQIVLIGLTPKQMNNLPEGIKGIRRTESTQELAAWYSAADIFINPTWQDNFPTTNIESLACGTPVVTYNTGGSPEAINEHTGVVIEKGDINGLVTAVEQIIRKGDGFFQIPCRKRAERLFNKKDRFLDYLEIYDKQLSYYKK
jgi:putative colanic acid biosynthesis glycosyltransferase